VVSVVVTVVAVVVTVAVVGTVVVVAGCVVVVAVPIEPLQGVVIVTGVVPLVVVVPAVVVPAVVVALVLDAPVVTVVPGSGRPLPPLSATAIAVAGPSAAAHAPATASLTHAHLTAVRNPPCRIKLRRRSGMPYGVIPTTQLSQVRALEAAGSIPSKTAYTQSGPVSLPGPGPP
jgi:hypothetical protein